MMDTYLALITTVTVGALEVWRSYRSGQGQVVN